MIQSLMGHCLPNSHTLEFVGVVWTSLRLYTRTATCKFVWALVLKPTIPLCVSSFEGSVKGVHCPLSPVLFNIFINDLPDGAEHLGVSIPMGSIAAWKGMSSLLLSYALFADDAVGLTATVEDTVEFCNHVSSWTVSNKMSVGISKCGILVIDPVEDGFQICEDLVYDQLCICGKSVPIVAKYVYLGTRVTEDVCKADMVVPKYDSGQRTLYKIMPYLGCKGIPVSSRLHLVQSVLILCLLYGAELYGMARHLTAKLQVWVNKALRTIAGISHEALVSSVALCNEMGISPVCAMAAAC